MRAEVTESRLEPDDKVGFSIAFLSAETVRYDGEGMVESAWTTTAYVAATNSLENTWDRSKGMSFAHAHVSL